MSRQVGTGAEGGTMQPHASPASPLILLAETQGDVRRSVHDHLEQTGFRALAAASTEDLFQALGSAPVGAVVLDAALRGADGMDLCRDLRERSDVPVILVGVSCSEVDRVVALELGADDVMAKPYSPRELAARLRAVLRRTRAERARSARRRKRARFDGWLIDFARREVRAVDGEAIHLTAAEFALLAVFLDHARVIIPRKRLMELAGVRDTPSSDRSIDVLVSRLRRKLGGPGYRAPIVTVRGAGYMFSAVVDRD
jgi:two-component system OmpR family response regulator